MMVPDLKCRDLKMKLFISMGTWVSLPDFLVICLVVVEMFCILLFGLCMALLIGQLQRRQETGWERGGWPLYQLSWWAPFVEKFYSKPQVQLMVVPEGDPKVASVFILWEQWTTVSSFMASHPAVLEMFLFGPDPLNDTAMLRAMPSWLQGSGQQTKKSPF